jgi:hypothetical protein
LWIAVQRFLLVLRRDVFVLPQPVSSMVLLLRRSVLWTICVRPVGLLR